MDFLQPAMMPGPDSSESHGGEDVSVYAIGTCWEEDFMSFLILCNVMVSIKVSLYLNVK